MLTEHLAHGAAGHLAGHAVDVDFLVLVFLAHGFFGLFGFQGGGFLAAVVIAFLLLLIDVDDIFHQEVALEPVHAMAVKHNLKPTGWAAEDTTGEAVGVTRVVEVTGTAPAQVVLAGQDDHRLSEHVQTDGTAQLLLQAIHGAGRPHDRSCPLDVHDGESLCQGLDE